MASLSISSDVIILAPEKQRKLNIERNMMLCFKPCE